MSAVYKIDSFQKEAEGAVAGWNFELLWDNCLDEFPIFFSYWIRVNQSIIW